MDSYITKIATVFKELTVQNGTFHCAFQSTPRRLLPNSFLKSCVLDTVPLWNQVSTVR